MATHGSVPAPLDARRHVPITAGRRRTRLGSVRATALLRCRKHAVEISASGHGWLSLAVKIKRRCRQSISGGVQGDAGLPPAMGLRNRCVVLAREQGAGQGWVRGAGFGAARHALLVILRARLAARSFGELSSVSARSFGRLTSSLVHPSQGRYTDGHPVFGRYRTQVYELCGATAATDTAL